MLGKVKMKCMCIVDKWNKELSERSLYKHNQANRLSLMRPPFIFEHTCTTQQAKGELTKQAS